MTICHGNGGWYFIAAVIEPNAKKMRLCLGDRANGALWVSDEDAFTGELNRSCTADLIMGMHANTYYYAGGLDDWFLDVDSELTMDDLTAFFCGSRTANGGDMAGMVDAQLVAGGVELRKVNGQYPAQGVLYTMPVECGLSGTGRVSASCEYISGITSVSRIETSTSDDLSSWSSWTDVLPDGKLASPNRKYIRFRATLATTDTTKTPVLKDIRLFDIPKAPYERIGFARPVVLDSNGAWEAVLENAYDIIVAGEINGDDTLTFKIPFPDSKRQYIKNEKKIQIVDDIYKVRTVTNVKDTDRSTATQTKAKCPILPDTTGTLSAKVVEDATYLVKYALCCNGYSVNIDNAEWSNGVEAAVKMFQTDLCLPVTGKIDVNTWMSLLLSKGNPDRACTACDTRFEITNKRADELKRKGYNIVGRYLTGGEFKGLRDDEPQRILNKGTSTR